MKYLIIILLFCFAGTASAADKKKSAKGPLVEIFIMGNQTPQEGSDEEYLVKFETALNPSNLSFSPTVTGGSVISFVPYNSTSYTLIVHWNCQSLSGNIRVDESYTGVYENLAITPESYLSPNFCHNVIPPVEYYPLNATTNKITVAVSHFCQGVYSFTYQWQEAPDPLSTFVDLVGETNETYAPPTSAVPTIRYYRRKTTFTVSSITYTVASTIATVHFGALLDPGTIYTSFPNTYAGSSGFIYETPAQYGQCDPLDYDYTWEISWDGGLNFYEMNHGETFLPGYPFYSDCLIRRSVRCYNTLLYSNVLAIHIVDQLTPGSLTQPTSTFAFYSIPTISEQPALGGLCASNNYVYTWERREENSNQWVSIGSGETYPPTAFLFGNCYLRRRVNCGGEDLYTNEIYLTVHPYISANTENLNYLRINNIRIPNVINWAQADIIPTGQKIQTTNYFDGFGRVMESVVKQGSIKQLSSADPNNLTNYIDVVKPYSYNSFGVSEKDYLPYATQTTLGFFKSNFESEQQSFNNQKYGEPNSSIYTYNQLSYDGSPLNRITATKKVGSFRNNNSGYLGISNQNSIYQQSVEPVQLWAIDYAPGSVPTTSVNATYPDNSLIKTVTFDEKGKMIVEYADYNGNLILKKVQDKEVNAGLDPNGYTGWLSTYFIYDDYDRLRYTITPRGVTEARANSWTISSGIKEGLCFYKEYDVKGRAIVAHTPDAGEVWNVYDNRDRVVLSQDAKQRNRPNESPSKPAQWSFILYDELDRKVAQGLIDDSRIRSVMQAFVNSLSPAVQNVDVYTGAWETIKAYNPVGGKITGGSGNYCQSCTAVYTNSVTYYDEYNNSSHPMQSMKFLHFAPTDNPYIKKPINTLRVRGMVVGKKSRVLDDKYDNGNLSDERFLKSTTYLNEDGDVIENLSDNLKSGVDIEYNQYDFSGALTSSRQVLSVPNNYYDAINIVSKYDFDLLGRTIKLRKIFTSATSTIDDLNRYKKISEVSFDEFGRMKSKKIGYKPGTTDDPLEIQDYNYSIQGMLIGINKDYALSNDNPANPFNSQWKRHFGLYLGYDNADNKFAASQWNGNTTGMIWRSQGDNTPRKYNFVYDNVNRLTAAIFTQKDNLSDNTQWANNKVDLSSYVSGYDENGNINGLKHIGIVPGNTGGVILDDLVYQYNASSNQLKNIQDLAFGGNQNLNGKQGDFKDYADPGNVDYLYDKNGNIEIDKNKNIINASSTLSSPVRGIVYNYINLPQEITVKDKSKTEFTYDADGSVLSRKITSLLSPPAPTRVLTYVNDFVFEGDELQYINHEEGKVRITEQIIPVNDASSAVNNVTILPNMIVATLPPTRKYGVLDFYIKDQVSNLRMVLTEETHIQNMHCTMEDGNATVASAEQQTFGDTGGGNQVTLTRYSRSLSGWPSSDNVSNKVSRLIKTTSGSQTSIGPNVLLKVMAGDNINANVKYFYHQAGVNAGNSGLLNDLVISLFNTLNLSGAATGIVHDNITNLNTVNAGVNSPLNPFLNNQQQSPSQSTTPKAYLNIVFFDEQFKFVEENSGAVMVDDAINGTDKIGLLPFGAVVPKNGYVYVFLSNESTNTPVYFDEFDVQHVRGDIVETNEYYPFGLRAQGVSAKAALKPKSNLGFEAGFSIADEENDFNEFALRTYNPQIGRWLQNDPYNEYASGYVGLGNNPINGVDPDGGGFFNNDGRSPIEKITGISGVGNLVVSAAAGALLGGIVGYINGDDNAWRKGAIIGAAFCFVGSFDWDYALHGGDQNTFIAATTEYRVNNGGIFDAPRLDVTWAKIKAFFSFGHLRVIKAYSQKGAALEIKRILDKKKKTLGSMIIDQHAHAPNDPSFDPLTSSMAIGNGAINSDDDRIKTPEDVAKSPFFQILDKYVTERTKVFAGNCWAAGSDDKGEGKGFYYTLKAMSTTGNWKKAIFYGEESETLSGNLLLQNSFTGHWHIDVNFYRYANHYGPNHDILGRKHADAPPFNPYREDLKLGHFRGIRNGQPVPTGTIYFGVSGNILSH